MYDRIQKNWFTVASIVLTETSLKLVGWRVETRIKNDLIWDLFLIAGIGRFLVALPKNRFICLPTWVL